MTAFNPSWIVRLFINMTINFKPRGVCSRKIELTIEDNIITALKFTGGCSGNLQGIARLAVGRDAGEIARMLKGTNCNGKGTSCPDQLSRAIEQALTSQ